MDKRIGTSATDTTAAVWPERDIRGNPYERGNGVMAHIGSKYFAVLPIGYVDDGTLEALRKQYKDAPAAPEPEGLHPIVPGMVIHFDDPIAREDPPAVERKKR